MSENNHDFYDYVLKVSGVLDRMDYYRLLGIPQDATDEQIAIAAARVVPMYDPEQHASAPPEVQQGLRVLHARLDEAALILGNRDSRSSYDQQLVAGDTRLATDQRQSVLPRTRADSIRSHSARQFYLHAEQNLEEGDFKQARLHISMAESRESGNLAIADLATRIEKNREALEGLTAEEQSRIATGKNRPLRMAVENLYGSAVWKELLANEELTNVEVARVSSNKNLSTDIMETIINHPSWIGDKSVQEALLKNPKMNTTLANIVLERISPMERRKISIVPSYPAKVRKAAKVNS